MSDSSLWLGIAVLLLGTLCTAVGSVLWTAKLPPCSSCGRLLSMAVLALAQVVAVVAALGLAGVLHAGTVLATFLIVASISVVRTGWGATRYELRMALRLWQRMGAEGIDLLRRSSTWPAAVGALIALIVLGVVSLAQPLLAYDDLLYHLPYPVDWLQSGRLDNPYQPWGAQASPYYGLNFELVYYWLLAPLRADVLAKMAQLPALALLSIAIYAAGRECGARRGDSLLAAFLPWSNPSLVTQAFFNANGDLWAASMLAAAVALALLVLTRGTAFLVPASLAVGLFLGSRSYSPLYAPVPVALLVLAVVLNWAGSRGDGAERRISSLARDMLGVIALVTLSGGFWYLRNLVLLGNPIHPSFEITAQGISLDVEGQPFRYDLLKFLVALRDYGPAMPAVLLGFLIAGLALTLAGRRCLGCRLLQNRSCVLLAPLAIFALSYIIPSPLREARLLLPAIAAAYLAVPLVLSDFGAYVSRASGQDARAPGRGQLGTITQRVDDGALSGPRVTLAVSTAVAAYPVYTSLKQLAGSHVTVESALPWAVLLVGAILCTVLLFTFGFRAPHLMSIGLGVCLAVFAGVALASVVAETRLHRYEVWERLWPGIPDGIGGDLGKGWSWIEQATAERGVTIAYAGSNLPYPLYGSRYQNRVVAVPLDGDLSKTHYGLGRDLKPVRQNHDFEKWKRALSDLGVEYLFVTYFPMRPGDRLLEDVWAQYDSGEFPPVYTSQQATVYGVLIGR